MNNLDVEVRPYDTYVNNVNKSIKIYGAGRDQDTGRAKGLTHVSSPLVQSTRRRAHDDRVTSRSSATVASANT
jgi:hypothetical protein